MGPLLYMWSVVDRYVIMWCMTVHVYIDVVTNSTSNWSSNFVLLFNILYCVAFHIFYVVL